MEGPVLTEGNHVVDSFAHSFGPRQRGHDAAVTDDLRPTQCSQSSMINAFYCSTGKRHNQIVGSQDVLTLPAKEQHHFKEECVNGMFSRESDDIMFLSITCVVSPRSRALRWSAGKPSFLTRLPWRWKGVI